jgi:predicted ATPase/transcriptional regulator with XRE-family HTH domain
MRTIGNAGNRTTLLAFGQHLKRLRLAADLTQEKLAERAMVSARLISDLERGTIHRPRRETAMLLANGLCLSGPDRDFFIALARGRPPVAAPDVSAERSPRHGLPHPPSQIVGRFEETGAVTALLLDPEIRLLTLTGPGGVGKTRLALEAAAKASGAVQDGVVFVDLSPLRDPVLVLVTIVQALGLLASPELSPRQALLNALRERQLLLVLDNFEHLAPAANAVADLLAECPALTVLATSRMPLKIRAEREYPVGPLALPDDRVATSVDALSQTPAVELFLRRAEAANREFALTPQNAADIAAITIRLDGLPLAIELAATRVKVLSPTALLARLEHRLPVLTSGAQDLPARQQTMRATLDWSHDLLTADEQTLFRGLAVFAGGCTLEAAEFVGGEGGDGLSEATPPKTAKPSSPPKRSDTPSVLDLLGGLVDKSLLRVHEQSGDERRFGMLETIREYGLERLAAAGEDQVMRDRHLAWCVGLVERASPELVRADQKRWFRRLDIEHDNLRVALGWALERQRGDLAQRLGAALHRFWILRGHFDEGRRWLEQALLLESGVSPTTRASALVGMAHIAYQQGDYESEPALQEALALFQAAGDSDGVGSALAALSMTVADRGDFVGAFALEEEALAIFRSRGNQAGVTRLLVARGLDAYDQGDYERAAVVLEEALALGQSVGSWYSVGHALNNLALVAQAQLDFDRAVTLQAEALDLWRGLGNVAGMAHSLENIAMFTAGQQQFGRAARLFAAAEALRARIGAPGRPRDREHLDMIIRDTSAQLGPVAFADAWAAGMKMSREEAIALALGDDRIQP